MNNLGRSIEVRTGTEEVENHFINHSIFSNAIDYTPIEATSTEIAYNWKRQIKNLFFF